MVKAVVGANWGDEGKGKEKRNMKGGPLMEVVPALQARSNTVPG